VDALHGKAKSFWGPPQRAAWMPCAPPRADTSSPESSATAGSPEALAAASALSVAFSTKLWPVSSGSGKPSSPADTVSTPTEANSSASSLALPLLWVAMTILSPALSSLTIVRRR